MEPDGRLLANLRRGVLDPCVLALLRTGERYGVELAAELVSLGLIGSEGTLYPALARMRTAGLVTTRWEESASGPARRYYRLTDSGHDSVERFAVTWASFARTVGTTLDHDDADETGPAR